VLNFIETSFSRVEAIVTALLSAWSNRVSGVSWISGFWGFEMFMNFIIKFLDARNSTLSLTSSCGLDSKNFEKLNQRSFTLIPFSLTAWTVPAMDSVFEFSLLILLIMALSPF